MHFLHLIPFIQSRLNLCLNLLHTRECGIGEKFKPLRQYMSVQAIHLNTWEIKTGWFQWIPQQPDPHTKFKDTILNQLSEKERIVLLHILIKFRCEWNSWLIFIGDLSPNFIFFFEEWSLGYAKVSVSKLLATKLWEFEFDPHHPYQKSGIVVYYITLAFRRLTTDT